MPQVGPVNESRERYRRLLPFKTDTTRKLARGFWLNRTKTDILILTGISTASELAKEKGSMIHLSQTFRGCRVDKRRPSKMQDARVHLSPRGRKNRVALAKTRAKPVSVPSYSSDYLTRLSTLFPSQVSATQSTPFYEERLTAVRTVLNLVASSFAPT